MSKQSFETLLLGRFVPVNKPSVPLMACWSKLLLQALRSRAKSQRSIKASEAAASVRL